MPIPQLNGNGALPAHNGQPYQATTLELIERYGTTPQRRDILRGYLGMRAAMRDLQFSGGHQWVGGRFLEHDRLHTIPPANLQVVSFCHLPDCFNDYEYAGLAATIRKRDQTLKKFHVDHMPVLLSWPADALLERTGEHQGTMSQQPSTGLSVGFIRIELSTPVEDAAALECLNKLEVRR